ncbi:hypothetical protein VTI74DRAFT_4405 [Chaetomium olivicolor]
MEVFLRNLPPDLTDHGVHRQLQPFMERLSVTDYLTEKQRSKTIGHLTFLHEADGIRFLQHHGEESLIPSQFAQPPGQTFNRGIAARYPATRARLTLMGKDVFCKLSNRKPDELTLRTISTRQANGVMRKYQLSNEGKLTFVAEWTTPESCLVKFTKRQLLIDLTARKVQLRITFQSIIELIWWEDGSVAVTLSWAPTILGPSTQDELAGVFAQLSLAQRMPNRRQRLEAIDNAHAQVSRFCMAYHFKVPNVITRHADANFQREISRMKHRDVVPMTR